MSAVRTWGRKTWVCSPASRASAPLDSQRTKNWHYTADYNMYQGENSNVPCFCRFEHCLQFFLCQNLTLHLLMRQTWSVRSPGKAVKSLSMEENGGVVVTENYSKLSILSNCSFSVREQSTSLMMGRKKSTAQKFHLNVHNVGFHPQTQKIEPLWSV